MTIPASVTIIKPNPFPGCPIESIDVSPDSPIYKAIEGVLFDEQQKMLVAYPGARKGEYAIPQGTQIIGESAFMYHDGLIGVIIPNTVTRIDNWAFYVCSGLTSVMIPDSVTSIGRQAFDDCSNLTSVVIPNSVTDIGDRAFDQCLKLTLTVTIGSYAEQYAKENKIRYDIIEPTAAADESTDETIEDSVGESLTEGTADQATSIIGTIKITSGANVRSNPGTGDNAKVAGKVAEGETFDVLAQDAATGWYQFIWKDGQEVWISSKMVEFTPSGN